MIYNYSLLEEKIKEKFYSKKRFADKMGIARTSLYSKLTNKTQFKQDEIIKALELLEINHEEMACYFFTPCA